MAARTAPDSRDYVCVRPGRRQEKRPQNTLRAGASKSGADLQFKPGGRWPADSYRPRQRGGHVKSRDSGGHQRMLAQ